MSEHNYEFFQNRLGNEARLGVSFCLLDQDGNVIRKDGFNNKLKMPMASTKKIAIALAVLKKVFDEYTLDLEDPIEITNSDFSPGPPWNTLDRHFFIPWDVKETKTIDQLLTLMLIESDNTSTDKLLSLIGGPEAVNNLMNELGLKGYCLSSTSKKLLSDYYECPGEKSFFNIMNTCWEFLSAFQMRPTEKTLFTNDYNVCTPNFMVKLLSMLVRESRKEQTSWLPKAAELICFKMEQCSTGKNLIRKGAEIYSSNIKLMGNKTGSLGGILNDTAFIHLNGDQWIILSIYTCFSPLERSLREKVIADLALDIFKKNIEVQFTEEREELSIVI